MARINALRIVMATLFAGALATIFILAYRPKQNNTSLHVFSNKEDCVVGGPGLAESFAGGEAGAAVGSWLVNSSVSALKKYLEEAANSTSSNLATGVGDVRYFKVESDQTKKLTVHNNLTCLVIVTGAFGTFDIHDVPRSLRLSSYLKENDPDQIFVKTNQGVTDFSTLIKFGLLDLPLTYFEFQVERDTYSRMYRFKPTVAYVREFNAVSGANDAKNAEFTILIVRPSLTGATQVPRLEGGHDLVGEIPIVIDHLKSGRVARANLTKFDDFRSVWMAEPDEFREAALAEVTKIGIGPGETVLLPPVNLYVTYREVDRPQLFFYILRKIVDENSESIRNSLSPEIRQTSPKPD